MRGLIALVMLLPSAVRAAPYQAYSHVETGFLYWGLGAQAVMRASSFRLLPYAVILVCAVWLVYRRLYAAQVQPLVSVFVYLIHAALILVLFWPEASYRFFGGVTALPGLVVSVDEGSVFSYVARENGETNDTAATMRLAGVNLTPSGAPVPRALDLMLTIATEAPRRLGERINADMDRPLAHLGAMQALLSQPLESDAARYALSEFHESCYKDAVADMTEDATVTSETTWQERLPWSPEMAPYLAKRVHLDPAGGPSDVLLGLSGTVQCVQIWNALQATVSADLNGEATGGGSTKINVYLDELGIPAQDTVRFVIGQELHKMMERFVEAPSLTGAYATVAGAKAGRRWRRRCGERRRQEGHLAAGRGGAVRHRGGSGGGHGERHPGVHAPGAVPDLVDAVHNGSAVGGGADLLPVRGAVVAVSGAARQAAGQLLPDAVLRALDAAVVVDCRRRQHDGRRHRLAARGGLDLRVGGRVLPRPRGGGGGRGAGDPAGAGDPGGGDVRDLARHRRHLARLIGR